MYKSHRQIITIVLIATVALVGFWLVRINFPGADITLTELLPWTDSAAVFVAYLTSPLTVILFAGLATLLAIELHHTQAWLHMVISLTTTVLICWLVKEITQLPRPAESALIASGLSDFAFPSTHAGTAGTLATVAFFHADRLTKLPSWLLSAVSVAGVFIVGWSRLILHAHTVIDITAGVMLGFSIGVIAIIIWPHCQTVFTWLLGYQQPINE